MLWEHFNWIEVEEGCLWISLEQVSRFLRSGRRPPRTAWQTVYAKPRKEHRSMMCLGQTSAAECGNYGNYLEGSKLFRSRQSCIWRISRSVNDLE